MKLKVTQIFIDKDIPGKRYYPGDIIEVDEWRAKEMLDKDVVEKVSSKKEPEKLVKRQNTFDELD